MPLSSRLIRNLRFRKKSLDEWLAAAFCVLSAVVVLFLLSDYALNWVRTDYFLVEVQWPIRQEMLFGGGYTLGPTPLNPYNLARFFFDCLGGDCGRARFLSFLVIHLDNMFRAWLAQYVPPHPSLSLTWGLSFASLYWLYLTVLNLTRDRTAAWLVVGLYALSEGFLSMLVMLAAPAKPLAGFFVIFCLYSASQLRTTGDRRAGSARAVLLYTSLILAYSTDESAWVLYGAIPIMFPELFSRRHLSLPICLLATFPLFLIFVTWIAPIATTYFWEPFKYNFDFWGWTLNIGPDGTGGTTLLDRFDVSSILATAWNMVRSEFAWPHSGTTVAIASVLPIALGLGAALAVGRPRLRSGLARAIILVVLFAIYEGLLMRRLGSGGIAYSTYYYGSLFPVFSLLMIGIAFACFRGILVARIACVVVSSYLGYISYSAAMDDNRSAMIEHERIYAHYLQVDHGALTAGAPLTRAKVEGYWRAARVGGDLEWAASFFLAKGRVVIREGRRLALHISRMLSLAQAS